MKKNVFILILAALAMVACSKPDPKPNNPGGSRPRPEKIYDYSPAAVKEVLDIQQKKLFNYFWACTNDECGLNRERTTSGGTFTLGGSGFGMMAMCIGVERGWITREQGAERVARACRFLDQKAMRIHGAWSHWVGADGNPHRFGDQIQCGDIVETSLMLMGLVCASEYFDGNTENEKTIRTLTEKFWNTIEWDFYTNGEDKLYWLYEQTEPQRMFHVIGGYNEALLCYILAMGTPSPEHRLSYRHYFGGWLAEGSISNKGCKYYGYPYQLGLIPYGGSLFLSHYSFLGLDPRYMQDEYVNYFNHGAYHTLLNRHYCVYESKKKNPYYKYDKFNWGLTACDGPRGKGYKARRPDNDDGVLAPTAALGSMPYTPFYSIQVLLNLHHDHPEFHTDYGFCDSFSYTDNWHDNDNISIDQGAAVVMIENYRSGLFWKLSKQNKNLQRGLEEAKMNQLNHERGFIYAYEDKMTNKCDLIRHPDRGVFEIYFWNTEAGDAKFEIANEEGKTVKSFTVSSTQGINLMSFDAEGIELEKSYTAKMLIGDEVIDTLPIVLH